MTRSFSIYLDFLRFFAAFLVLLSHSAELYKTDIKIFFFGHEAVIIFFILSGFVIAYVTDIKEKTFRHYTIARMARIYSVAIPAIILTALLDFAGFSIDAAAYPDGKQAWDYAPIRILSSLLFINEIWNVSIQLFSNVPYWSLNYEVWYYIGFAALTFVEGKKRWLIFAGVCLIVGPKILLLMPLWWLGVFIYKSHYLKKISIAFATILLVLSIYGVYLYIEYNLRQWGSSYLMDLVGSDLHHELAFSKHFIMDYYFGLVVFIHFIAIRGLCNHFPNFFDKIEWPIRIIAGSTFSLYLLHQPLLLFFHSIINSVELDTNVHYLILLVTFISAFLISLVTEQKKFLWKFWISNFIEYIETIIAKKFSAFKK